MNVNVEKIQNGYLVTEAFSRRYTFKTFGEVCAFLYRAASRKVTDNGDQVAKLVDELLESEKES